MMNELYGKFNMVALPGGQFGQEMGLFSNKRASKMEDFKGMRVRTVGWYMDILNNLGASVSPLLPFYTLFTFSFIYCQLA